MQPQGRRENGSAAIQQVTEQGFAFHAAPRPGEWFNDPNGLVYFDGRYRLYMQHSAAAPGFKDIGWGAASSVDLLSWRWDGIAIPFENNVSAYSGSVPLTAPFEAFLTRNERQGSTNTQTQWRATSSDGTLLTFDEEALGPAGRNVRDPFVFQCAATRDWRMLLAEPCDWHDWRTQRPSILSVWASPDRSSWRRAGTIGPFDPAGVMWEVPVLLDFGATQVLVLSIVDRRDDRMQSSVRYIAGRFDGTAFVAASAQGHVDYGPDFYAACPNTVDGWPTSDRVLVGWASSWATARTISWPDRINGGPISLPRVVRWHDDRLHFAPIAAARAHAAWQATWQPGAVLNLIVEGETAAMTLTIGHDGRIEAGRSAIHAALAWRAQGLPNMARASDITVFVDAGLVEVFIEQPGIAMTVFVPGGTFRSGYLR